MTFDEWWAETWHSGDAHPMLTASFKEIAYKAWHARDVEIERLQAMIPPQWLMGTEGFKP